MWIEPLRVNDIIPKHRREEFIKKVFSNLTDIYQLSHRFTLALRARQQEHPIVSQISDIMQHFVAEFEPFVYYGARQHQAKHTYEHERYSNPKFALFAEVRQLSRFLSLDLPLLVQKSNCFCFCFSANRKRRCISQIGIKWLLDKTNHTSWKIYITVRQDTCSHSYESS